MSLKRAVDGEQGVDSLCAVTISKMDKKLDLLDSHSMPVFSVTSSQEIFKDNYIIHECSP